MNQDKLIEKLRETLPAVFSRTEVERLMPGTLSSKTLANLQSAGDGPPIWKQGRRCLYEKDSFLRWYSKRVHKVEL